MALISGFSHFMKKQGTTKSFSWDVYNNETIRNETEIRECGNEHFKEMSGNEVVKGDVEKNAINVSLQEKKSYTVSYWQ